MFFERRESIRVRPPIREPVEVQFVTANMLALVHAVDISERGIALGMNVRLDLKMIGKQVDLVVTIPGYPPFHTQGVIRRVSPSDGYIIGLKFVSLPAKGLESIRDYVEHRRDARASARMRISG